MADLVELFGGHFMSPVPDPYAAYARLRDAEPVKLVDLWMGPGYLVTRYQDVHTVCTDPATYSSHANAAGIGLVMGRTILEMDGKEHSKHRGIIAPAFVETFDRDSDGVSSGRQTFELVFSLAVGDGGEILFRGLVGDGYGRGRNRSAPGISHLSFDAPACGISDKESG